jgi:HD-GYP domain-containing protein (c-di-GMP phosphodiesterase class II)
VSNTILDKPAKLDAEEWVQMQRHAEYSEKILSRISVFSDLAPIASAHHEKLNGSGYPKGLKGDEIKIESRILAVADIFDALTADRPYRPAMSIDRALSIMAQDLDTAIDRTCFEALMHALQKTGLKAA